jgi:hypothetical protein
MKTMPSKSKKQARLMAAVAHNPAFAKKVGIPQSVGRDFHAADKRVGKYAEGGHVLPSSTEDDEDWTDTYVKRPMAGLASMWGGIDPETGEFGETAMHNLVRAWKGEPRSKRRSLGIERDVASTPMLAELWGGTPPDFAVKASDESGAIRNAAREGLGLDPPHGFTENAMESAGIMAGQLPIPGSNAKKLRKLKEAAGFLPKIKKGLKAIPGAAAEWFSPTIDPKLGNYVKGSLFGGTMGAGADYLKDYMDEKQQKDWIADAMAEVLAEETTENDGSTDDEAFAELGYAEGGRVKKAVELIKGLRPVLEEVADPAIRKAKIDEALASLKGVQGVPRTTRVVASEVADTPHRDESLVRLLENAAPLLREREMDLSKVLGPMAPPPPNVSEGLPPGGFGHLTPEYFNEHVLKLGGREFKNPQKAFAEEMSQQDLDDTDWEAMHDRSEYAEGGKVNNPWESPQATKIDPATLPANPGSQLPSQGASPLSQAWYENYGAGPEHLFLGDRTIKLPDYWGPQHPSQPPPTQQEPQGSWLPAAGLVGLSLYDEWKKKRGEGEDASQDAFWREMHDSASNTADTDAWVNRQLDDYANTAPVPHVNNDGTTSYVQPTRDFWQQMHDSASNTANTDTWVGQQLEDYRQNADMPTANYEEDDSLLSGTNLGNAWQGAQGAYGLYSGVEQGGVQGGAQALSGASDLYSSVMGPEAYGAGALGRTAGTVGGLSDIYSGVETGGVGGYSQAASGLAQTASSLGYANSAVSSLGTAATVVGALYSAYGAYESAAVGDKKSAAMQGAAAGAAIGSIVPVIGTAVGAVIGAAIGAIGASFGNKEMASEAYYGAHKQLDSSKQIRGWSPEQVNGAVFETIKSHTKSGNVNKFKDVAEMYTAFGITKDAQNHYKDVQGQMGDFIQGVIKTAQNMGALPTDPVALRQLDGQQVYDKVVMPAMAAKYKETTGKESEGWVGDSKQGAGSEFHNLFADWTDWMMANWTDLQKPAVVPQAVTAGAKRGRANVAKFARGGRVESVFDHNPRSGAYSVL